MTTLDDLVAVPLQSFSTDTLASLRRDGKCEGYFFEFKSEWKPEDVTRCVCAFANAAGGYLMFGVGTDSKGCIDAMPGLENGPEYPLLAKDRIVGHISPLPAWDAVSVLSPDDASRWVLVLRIEPSARPPHVVTTSGKHYIRTPSACDPITDRATLDALYARGVAGEAAADRRRIELTNLPGDEQAEGSEWTVTVIGVPDPYLGGGTYPFLVGPEWRERGRELFPTQEARVTPRHMLEDGALFEGGAGVQYALATDGSVRARWVLGPNRLPANYSESVPTDWIGWVIDDVLRAQSRLQPAVRQSRISVDLTNVGGRTVVEGKTNRVNVPSRGHLPSDWSRETVTLTEEPYAAETRGAIVRRLWRAAGGEAVEPG